MINILIANKKIIVLGLIIAVSYFILRLVNLTLIPVFTDEAIYLRWAQIAWHDSAWRFISLTDGKQPLFIWLMIPFMKLINDPLVAGRTASVFIGFFNMTVLSIVAYELFKDKKVAIFAAILYLLSPFGMFYDRMALYDSLVVLTCLISLYLEIKLAKTPRLDLALILGMSLGAGFLTKSSAVFSIVLLPVSLLLFNWKDKDLKLNLGKWFFYAALASFFGYFYFNLLRLSPFFHIIGTKNLLFVVSFEEFIKAPFSGLVGNLRALTDWFVNYTTWPMFITLLVSLLHGLKKDAQKTFLIFAWFFVPFAALAAFGRVIYPRFILFMVIPLFLIVADFLVFLSQKINNKIFLAVIYILIFAFPVYSIGTLLIQPAISPIPQADKGQMINDWPSGYGVKEAVAYLKVQAKTQKIVIGTEGTFGLMPYALELYLVDNPNVKIKPFWPVREIPKEILADAVLYKTFFVFNETQVIPENYPLVLIGKYPKGDNLTQFLRLYEVVQ